MIEYVIQGKIAVITGCSDEEREIILPETIDGVPVGKIESNSFNEMHNLHRVVFPKTVKVIGGYAFAGCKNLEEVVFSEGLEVIEDWAFISCNIANVELPDSVKSVGKNAFMGNECKIELDEFLLKKNSPKKEAKKNKIPMTIFPILLWDSVENITEEIIVDRMNYEAVQLKEVHKKTMLEEELDLPFMFDGDEFILAMFSKKPLGNFSLKTEEESSLKIGLYESDDPSFLHLQLEVFSAKESMGVVHFKAPYMESLEWDITDKIEIQNNGFYYFLKGKVNMECYGNANPESEFSFNIMEELVNRYATQEKNGLITDEQFAQFKEELAEIKLGLLVEFLKNINGSPVLRFFINLFQALMEDAEVNKEGIEAYISTTLEDIYNQLGDWDSLEEICFNMKAVRFLTDYTGLSLAELKEKYGVNLEENGEVLDEEGILFYRNAFSNLESNVSLYGDFIEKILIEMDTINKKYENMAYSE